MTALSTKISQGTMGAAVDTAHQTVLLDSGLLAFHGGKVLLLEEPPSDFKWLESFACAVWAEGVPSTDLELGNRVRAIDIMYGFYWKSTDQQRNPGEASIADLEELWDRAIWTNEKLVWKAPSFGWPPVPSGRPAALEANVEVAEQILDQDPTDYGRVFDDKGKRCDELLAEFVARYAVRFPA